MNWKSKNEHVCKGLFLYVQKELDITATDLSKDCLLDFLPRIPAIRWLSAGQLDGMTDSVLKVNSSV